MTTELLEIMKEDIKRCKKLKVQIKVHISYTKH